MIFPTYVSRTLLAFSFFASSANASGPAGPSGVDLVGEHARGFQIHCIVALGQLVGHINFHGLLLHTCVCMSYSLESRSP